MRILHILNDGMTDLPERIIREQGLWHDVKVIDLSKAEQTYDDIIRDIFMFDRVISW